MQVNGAKYPLNSMDNEMLQKADMIFARAMEEQMKTPAMQEVSNMMNRG